MLSKIDGLKYIVKLSNAAVIDISESKLDNPKYTLIIVMHFAVTETKIREG